MRLRARDTDAIPPDIEEALRRAFLEPPARETEERHLALIEAERVRVGSRPRRGETFASTRARVTVILGVAILALPVALAGLALAGLRLPGPVDSAFEAVGIELPNQAQDEDGGDGSAGEKVRGGAGDGRAAASGSEDIAGEDGEQSSADGSHGPEDRPARVGDGNGSGAPPSHAQDGVTGAPPHSQQGGQGVGTPPQHAQDGAGGAPPHAQDDAGDPPPHAQGDTAREPEPATPYRPPREPRPMTPRPETSGETDSTAAGSAG